MNLIAKAVEKLDAWANIVTALGDKRRDKKTSATVDWTRLTESDCNALYSGSDIARKICDTLPKEAFREGYDVKHETIDSDENLTKLLTDEADRLKINARLLEAACKGRANGGAAIIAIPENVLELREPLNLKAVRRITNLLVLTQFELSYSDIDSDIRSPNFGMPLSYTISPRGHATLTGLRVHHSHVIRFDGAPLPRAHFQQNNYWNDSVLNAAKEAIRDYDMSLSAVATMLADSSVPVYKIKGLAEMVAQGDDDAVVRRMTIIDIVRSVARAVVLDSDSEEFSYQDRSFAGVNECVGRVGGRLVVASDMPHTKLLGESPSGSNATGNSTTMQWYDEVASWQENYLKERIMKVWDIVFSQTTGPTKGVIPIGYSVLFAPLWQPTETETATNRKLQAETDVMYVQAGIVQPEVVTKSRFTSEGYSFETLPDDTLDDVKPELSESAQAEVAAMVPPTATPIATPQASGELTQQDIALNSAQVTSLLEIISKVALNQLPRDSALEIIVAAFQMRREVAERMLGSVGKTFKPAVTEEAPSGKPTQSESAQTSV